MCYALLTNRVAHFLCLLLLITFSMSEHMVAQSASSSVHLVAVVPGWVKLSMDAAQIRLHFEPDVPPSSESLPLTVTWNVNPRETRGFEVVGYFSHRHAALTSVRTNQQIASSRIQGRYGDGDFRTFTEARGIGVAGASLMLLARHVTEGQISGSVSETLQLRLDPALNDIPAGDYEGILHLEVRLY